MELKDDDEDDLLNSFDNNLLSDDNLSQKSMNCRLNINKEDEESEEVKKAKEEDKKFRKRC